MDVIWAIHMNLLDLITVQNMFQLLYAPPVWIPCPDVAGAENIILCELVFVPCYLSALPFVYHLLSHVFVIAAPHSENKSKIFLSFKFA